VAREYRFDQTEKWAADLLLGMIEAHTYSKHQDLLPFLDYAVISGRSSLRSLVYNRLLDLISKGSVNYTRVIRFAEKKEGGTWEGVLGKALCWLW